MVQPLQIAFEAIGERPLDAFFTAVLLIFSFLVLLALYAWRPNLKTRA